jgi:hypothetical protein
MGDVKPVFGWGALALHGDPYPFLLASSVKATRQETQRHMASAWSIEGDTYWQQGWKRAYRKGWRTVRVKIEPAFQYKDPTHDRR